MLRFKEAKCVLLRFVSGKVLFDNTYTINDLPIQSVNMHRDLGIMVSSDMSWSSHHDHIVSKAYKILGLLRRYFNTSNSTSKRKRLYFSLVRSQLVYCSQLWRPYLIKDIVKLEKIQRRATKFILNNYSLDYKTRLESLNMLPLMHIYEINDILFCIKSLKSPNVHFNIEDFISWSRNVTRFGTRSMMCHRHSPNLTASNFFFRRLPRLWNSLPCFDLDQSLSTIKLKLTHYMYDHFLTTFIPANPCTFHYFCPCSTLTSTAPLSALY